MFVQLLQQQRHLATADAVNPLQKQLLPATASAAVLTAAAVTAIAVAITSAAITAVAAAAADARSTRCSVG